MYQKPDNDFSNQERKLARRKLLLGASAVTGAAAIAAVGGGLALSGAHAAPASAGSSLPAQASSRKRKTRGSSPRLSLNNSNDNYAP